MNINKSEIKQVGSCNFCNRGTLNQKGDNLNYPYYKVYVLRGSQLEVKVCAYCVMELIEYFNKR